MKNIYQRINELLSEGLSLPKTGKMSDAAGGYQFHQTDELLAFLRPLMVKYGIHLSYSVSDHSFNQLVIESVKGSRQQKQTMKIIKIKLTNVDEPNDFIEGQEVGYGIDSEDKGPGKATSYAIKTWLLNIFMLRGQPDEDRLETFDGWIGGDELDEIRQLIAETKADESIILKMANADRLEKIKISKAGIVLNLLRSKLAKSQKAAAAKG